MKTETPVEAQRDQIPSYVVTELAPGRVAGQRVSNGDVITLTDDQARSELLSGHIRPADVEGKKAE